MYRKRLFKDKIARYLFLSLTVFSGVIVVIMAAGLYKRSMPILAIRPFSDLLTSASWHPLKKEFGFLPFIMGSLWVTGLAIIIAVPPCFLTSIYLSEYAPKWMRGWANPLIDLLAGIPSVVYGMWAVLVIVPLIKNKIAPFFGVASTGYGVLAASIILAIMIFPIIIHVCVEVFRAVPYEVREASLALGATKWQTIKHVVVRKALPGAMAAVVLGLSRAFGETMAVMMVAGNVARIPKSVFDPAYPLPSLIANNYGELLSVPLYDSALLFASFILLLVVLFFNIASRIILVRIERYTQ